MKYHIIQLLVCIVGTIIVLLLYYNLWKLSHCLYDYRFAQICSEIDFKSSQKAKEDETLERKEVITQTPPVEHSSIQNDLSDSNHIIFNDMHFDKGDWYRSTISVIY